MTAKHEQLLGFLIGALEDDEQEIVHAQLKEDPELQQKLEVLRRRLEPLESFRRQYEPPEGLAAATCAFVAAEQERRAVVPAAGARAELAGSVAAGRHWSLLDVAVVSAVFFAAALLFLPAIASSRHAARLAQCQNNLREIGVALATYSDHDPRNSFPPIAPQGKQAFAGIYAPTLIDGGFLRDPRLVFCPASENARHGRSGGIPTLRQIAEAEGEQLISLQQRAGGDYGYSLGYMQQVGYVPPKNLGRSHFPIMTDAPSFNMPHRHSANHGGRDHNVLFEDLHVRHVKGNLASRCPDDPLHNRQGEVAAGVDQEDAVIGNSFSSPFPRKLSSR